jgi:hypothetical protein
VNSPSMLRLVSFSLLLCMALTMSSLPLSAQSLSAAEAGGLRDTVRLVQVFGAGPLTAVDLAGFDIVESADDRSSATVIAKSWDLAQLDARQLSYDILEEDLEAFYAARLATPEQLADMRAASAASGGSSISPDFGQGSMGGFFTFSEVVGVLDQLSAQYPSIMTAKQSIGQSLEGRDLWVVKVSDNPGVDENEPEVRFDALHHAREPQSMETQLYYLVWLLENYGSDPLATYLVDERETWFIPVVNPDGYEYNRANSPNGGGLWRKNRRDNVGSSFDGVDLNRNYGFQWGFDNLGSSPSASSDTYRGTGPASEPEVAAMTAFIAARDFQTALSMHCYSDLWLAPLGYIPSVPVNDNDYEEVGALATEVNGYAYGTASTLLYPANGVTIDTDHGVHGTMSWTPEIGGQFDGFWPQTNKIVPLAQENLEALQRTALAAGPYLRATGVLLQDEGDGDGIFEPGETVAVRIDGRNSGRGTSAVATASLGSPSGFVTFTTGSVPLSSWAGFSDIDNSATLLRFEIDANIPTGSPVSISVSLGELGLTETLTRSFNVNNDWALSGAGLAGLNGVPALSATGALVAGQPGALELSSAAPSAAAYLILGFTQLNGSFKGGVLVPSPDLILDSLTTDGSGELVLPFNWPNGVPASTQLWAQYWVTDVAATVGFAASNGLVGTAR